MSSHLVGYATCAGVTERKVFRTPVARAQYVLEQTIFAQYLKATSHNITACVQDYLDAVEDLKKGLPKSLPGNPMENLYAKYVQAILAPWSVTINEMETLLSLEDPKLEWKPSLKREFYLPFLNQMGYGIPDSCPDGTIDNPIIYAPALVRTTVPYTGVAVPYPDQLCISMYTFCDGITKYTFVPGSMNTDGYGGRGRGIDFLSSWLKQMTFSDFNISYLFGILSSFVLEHGRHAMPLKNRDSYMYSVLDTCYEIIAYPEDMVISQDKKGHSTRRNKRTPYGVKQFTDLLKSFLQQYRIVNDENAYVLGLFLNKVGEYDDALISYFTEDKESISYASLTSFKQSVFSESMDDRLTVSTEASTPEVPMDDDPDSTDTTIPEEEEGTDDTVSTGEDDITYARDPLKLLMELAKPNESFSDHLYRRLVMERLTCVIKNPPRAMPTSEILLMKRWMSLWVNLVSIQTIRDFLSRLSFQLMDTKQVKGTEALA